jgi:hypothetical protein
MALRVPQYNAPQVEQRALPGVALPSSASPGSFGGEQAAALGRLGEGLTRVGAAAAQFEAVENEKHDANLFMQADSALKEKYLQYDSEVKTRTGIKAWGVAKETEQWWNKARSDNAPKFKTDAGRRMFERSFDGLRLQSIASVRDFETKQQNESLVSSAQASIVSSTNWTAANPNDGNIGKGEAEINRAVNLIGSVKGYDAATLEAVRQEKIGTMYKQVLQGIVNNNPQDARPFFMAFKSKIPGTDHAEIEKLIGIGEAKAAAPQLASKYLAGNVSQEAALADVRKKYENDPNVDIFEREVKSVFAERDAAKRDRVNTLVDRISVDFGTRYRTADVSASHLAELKALDGSTWAGVKAHMEAKIKSLAGEGSGLRTDYKTYNELYDLAGTDPNKFAAVNIMSYRGKLKDSDFEEMKRLQFSIRNSLTKADSKSEAKALLDLQTYQGQLKNTFDRLGWTRKDDQDRIGEFTSVASDLIRSEEAAIGRKLRDEEREVLINKLATKEDAPWYRSSKMYFERLKEGKEKGFKAEVTIKDVPVSERRKIEAALTRMKKPISDATVIDLYKRKLGVQ